MKSRSDSRKGFSLIEMVAVVTILGLLMGAISLNWLAPLKKAQLLESVRQIRSLDHHSRLHAKGRNCSLNMSLDLESGQFTYERLSDQRIRSTQTYTLPKGHQIRQVVTPVETIKKGQFRYAIGQYGMSQSFAIQIADGNRNKWICIVGGTGQSVIYENDSEISFPETL